MLYQPLSRDELAAHIEGHAKNTRVPVMIHLWVHPQEFGDREPQVREILAKYPQDAQIITFDMPDIFNGREDDPEYRWVNFDDPDPNNVCGLDAKIAIKDWSQLDDILKDWPDPNYPGLFRWNEPADGRYRLGHFWFCYFERHWWLRGMVNALTDYYTDPESVHCFFRAITDFYKATIKRGKDELGLDGFLTGDDLGHQTGGFFSPKIFKEFYKPYYKELIEYAHSLGMHFWLHSCGNISELIPDFIDIGLDVLHPIQKHTMDEREIAAKFGDKLCIWAGLDVQQVIPWGTSEDVRAEVRHLVDTYYRPGGRLIMTAGNGINGDCTIPSLEAFYDEAFKYGETKAKE